MITLQKNAATAALRRIPILLYSDSDGVTPWAGSVTGVKAKLSFRGGAEADSTADIVRVAGALHYVELTQGESDTSTGMVTARVPAVAGLLEGVGIAEIAGYDPFAAGLLASDITADIDANSVAIATIDALVDTRLPAALVGGRMDSSVGAMAAAVLTAAAIAADAITAAKIADGAIDAGSIAAGAITNAKVADGLLSAAKFATDSIAAAAVKADAVTKIQTGLAAGADMTTVLANLATLLGRDAVYVKNVAVTAFVFPMELTDGTPGTGLTVAGSISKDGGAFAALGGSVTEISAGWYKVNIAQAEMNADEIALKFTATGAKQRNIKIRTQS